MRSRDHVLADYGLAGVRGATPDGLEIRIFCSTGREVFLTKPKAETLAAELVLSGAMRESDELISALVGDD